MEVAADLNGTVTGIFHEQARGATSCVGMDWAGGIIEKIFARFHVFTSASFDWVVDGDELRAVGKRGFHLHFVNHFRDSFHDLLTHENSCAGAHDFGDAFPIAGRFQYFGGEDGDGLDVVEFQAASLAAASEVGGNDDHQLLLLTGCQVHGCL
jgi:hypothetical protein